MPVKTVKSNNLQKRGVACDLPSIQARLHRIQGQLVGIEKMLAEKRDCLQVLQQVVASREALRTVAVAVLQQQAQGCFQGDKKTESVLELQQIVEALFKAV